MLLLGPPKEVNLPFPMPSRSCLVLGRSSQLDCYDYPRENCNMAYNSPKMLNKINTSIKEIMIGTHPLSLSYRYTSSR
jgi:hypothetical protein